MIESTLRFDDVEDVPGLLPASPGGSKVTYVVKRTERETAWERGYLTGTPLAHRYM